MYNIYSQKIIFNSLAFAIITIILTMCKQDKITHEILKTVAKYHLYS